MDAGGRKAYRVDVQPLLSYWIMKRMTMSQMENLQGGSGWGCIAGVVAGTAFFVAGSIATAGAGVPAAILGIASWHTSILLGCLS